MKQTKVNRNLILKEPKGGIYYGTDALLLAHFIGVFNKGVGVDLGTGSGIIPLLLLSSGSSARITGIEIQKEYVDIANHNSKTNGFEDKFVAIHGDLREIKTILLSGGADVVFSNPPYLKTNVGKRCITDQKNIAFHEVMCTIEDVCFAAAWGLKSGGYFYVIYRPERLTSLICALKANNLEPKKMQFVTPSIDKRPSLVLIQAKKDAKEGLTICNNLYIYSDKSHTEYSPQMKKIYKEFE